MYRLAVVNSHPIQYFAPLYRRLAREPDIDLTVLYCSRRGVERYEDSGFDREVRWDVPLLDGYRSCFLNNLRQEGASEGFFGLVNPGVVPKLLRERYDALWIHGHNNATFVAALLAAQAVRTPILMRCETHLGLERGRVKRALRHPLLKFVYGRFCACVMPIGSANDAFYRSLGIPNDRRFAAPYVVDNAHFMRGTDGAKRESIRRSLGLPLDVPLILYVSKLTPRKRPIDLLRAFAQLRNSGEQACLAIVGTGELELELRRYTNEHCIPDTHFMGFQNQSDLPSTYAAADVFVLPSENEPWGLVINEAMAAGLPIVASREIGAVQDLLLHGDNGFTFPVGDVHRLTEHLRTLLRDDRLRAEMGLRSRQRIAEWDFERCVAGIRRALAHVCEGHRIQLETTGESIPP